MANQNTKTANVMERFRDLPEDLQKAIFSPNTADAILAAGKNSGIAIDKIGELADETGLVMLGITPPGEFIRNLTRRLELDPEKAKAVAEEINQKIFQPVRESLKKVHGLGEAPKAPTQPDATKQKPLPTRSDITEKIIPPEIETKVKAIFDEIERKKSHKYAPEIPPIFAKNIPSFAETTEGKPLKDELEADLEKKLSEAKLQQNNYQKIADPYREPI